MIIKKSNFKVIQEIDSEAMAEITENCEFMTYKYKCESGGKNWAETVYRLLEEYLHTQQLPEWCEDELDFQIMLGSLFGEALRSEYGWKWLNLGDDENDLTYYITSPHDKFCCQPFWLVEKIMKRENIGFDGKNDNTVLLIFNMCKNIENRMTSVLYLTIS